MTTGKTRGWDAGREKKWITGKWRNVEDYNNETGRESEGLTKQTKELHMSMARERRTDRQTDRRIDRLADGNTET